MWYPNDVQHLQTLSEQMSRMILRWVHRHLSWSQDLRGRDTAVRAGR